MVFFHDSALPESLYVHYPICQHVCSYCDFNVYSRANAEKVFGRDFDSMWGAALGKHLKHLMPSRSNLVSLYFGGGTPGLLSTESLESALQELSGFFNFSENMEFSLELNPENLSTAKLRQLKYRGVNRPSIGVQSLKSTELKRLERLSTVQSLLPALDLIASNFENYSFDLMLGIPEQDLSSLEKSLDGLLAFSPPHISIYMLTLASDHKWHQSKKIESMLPDENQSSNFYGFVCDRLRAEGYEHYELSNFAKPSFFSRHNSRYWRPEYSYAALGPGAHGYDAKGQRRFEMLRDPMKWASSDSGIADIESLGPDEQALESFYLKLRTRVPIPCTARLKPKVDIHAADGHLELQNGSFVISEASWVLMEAIAAELVRGI